MKSGKKNNRIITDNRRVYYDYFIEDRIEAGIVLTGTEVKSIRAGQLSLQEAYIGIEDGEIFLYGMHIRPYEQGNRFNHEPLRKRKLLLHKNEIRKLSVQTMQKGMTLVPTKLYFKQGKVKVEVGVARGKRQYDKRQDEAKRAADRSIKQAMKRDRYNA